MNKLSVALFALSAVVFPTTTVADLCKLISAGQPLSSAFPNPENCGVAQSETGLSEDFCAWHFERGSHTAELIFKREIAALQVCSQSVETDQPVNHPDSYDLRVFAFDGRRISLSMKEKYALNSRYIFIRISR